MPSEHHPAHPPLLDPSDARDNVGGYDDYPELYTRWFEYATFLPIFRAHGSRKYNEVWSYGKQAEPILEKYLRLRYQLMPYIYSLAYKTYQTGAPFMRALFMDFPNDPKVADLGDEYMFGPAFLVAPVTEQGATSRAVYLPAGADWYNYWTNERVHGGQTIKVDAPIDIVPLFVRAGSIVPLGRESRARTRFRGSQECVSIPEPTRTSPSTRTTARPTPTKKATARSLICTGTMPLKSSRTRARKHGMAPILTSWKSYTTDAWSDGRPPPSGRNPARGVGG